MKSKRIHAGRYEVTTDVGNFSVWQEPVNSDYPRRWFVNDDPDVAGETLKADGFRTKCQAVEWLARHIEDLPLTCRECLQEFHRDEVTDGLCDECNKEECPECEGTGLDQHPTEDDEEASADCDYCGGDGVV